MQVSKSESVAVTHQQIQERATILVVGEDCFPIVASVDEVKARFLGPLQRTRHAWHDGLSNPNATVLPRRPSHPIGMRTGAI
jgi:hypothetical protein